MLHPDRPLVVLDHEDARQLVQARHVEALVELPDVARAVTEKVHGDAVGGLVAEDLAPVLDLEGRAEADGDPLADEGEAAEEAVLLGEHMHGAGVFFGFFFGGGWKVSFFCFFALVLLRAKRQRGEEAFSILSPSSKAAAERRSSLLSPRRKHFEKKLTHPPCPRQMPVFLPNSSAMISRAGTFFDSAWTWSR